MRSFLFALLAPAPALAWEFSPDPICTLTHQTDAAEIAITFDAALPEYALFITLRTDTWTEHPTFEMTFTDGRDLAIGTTRHSLSADGATLTVRDRGFGNVLDGIEFNNRLTAQSGPVSIAAQTDTAKEALRAFRACPQDPPATS